MEMITVHSHAIIRDAKRSLNAVQEVAQALDCVIVTVDYRPALSIFSGCTRA
jgi:hypothetical protein